MAPVEPTVWALDPHGRAKHLILQRHLDAWLPIMGRSFAELLYVDGFAGPGIYEGGEPGSPIIALRAALFHKAFTTKPPKAVLRFFFIEERADRVERLKAEIAALASQQSIPTWIKHFVAHGEFEPVMKKSFPNLSNAGRRPMFVFIDPFGYSGLPMELIARIAGVPHSECLINFTYKSIGRWGGHGDPKKEAHLDALYGTPTWRERWGNEEAMVDLYRDQLAKLGGFRYICAFKMKDARNVTEYFLAFATNEPKGLTVMKRAMWKADPQTGRVFSDANDPHQLFLDIPIAPLRDLLLREFGGRAPVTMRTVIEWVRHTHYSEDMHLKEKTLTPLEKKEGLLRVTRPPGARKGTFPDDALLEFSQTR